MDHGVTVRTVLPLKIAGDDGRDPTAEEVVATLDDLGDDERPVSKCVCSRCRLSASPRSTTRLDTMPYRLRHMPR